MKKIQTFLMKTKIVSGENLTSHVGEYVKELNGKNIMIVTDPGIINAGLLKRLEKNLKDMSIDFTIYSEVVSNPIISSIEKGAEIAKEAKTDLFIALGGGSSIDTAKGINILLSNGGGIKNYAGANKVQKPTCPLIAIPTTCGTGSEVTWSTVVSDPEQGYKFPVLTTHVMPDIAIIDPTLMSSLPSKLIASTGMDALTHALEAYVSTNAQPISDALAIHAIELISNNLRQAVHYQENQNYISEMAIASTIAGIALNMPMLGLVHAMATPLGGIFNIPHGIANAVLLPYVMKFNLVACPERFAKIAQVMGEKVERLTTLEAAEKAFKAVQKLSSDVGIPNNLKDIGMDISKLEKLAEDSMKSGNCNTNPRKNSIDEVKAIFCDAYEGQL